MTNIKTFDYIIVGAGLFGSCVAYQFKNAGKRCLIIDKRHHTGGNLYCEEIEGIRVHIYGPHIFHTSNIEVWKFVNSLVKFNNFIYSPLAYYKGSLYNLPFNMNTFYQLWGVVTPAQARKKVAQQIKMNKIIAPKNLEEQALNIIGSDIYQILIKGYTEKQWGRNATDLPPFIIKRIPIRYTFNNNYYNDTFQGIPIGGYNMLIDSLLEGVEIKLNTDFIKNKEYFENIGKKIIYTGSIDEFYNYKLGRLEYRSLDFVNTIKYTSDFQGNAAVNYTENNIPYTRIIEHKYFEFGNQEHTIITKEYPAVFNGLNEPYYPINTSYNNNLFLKYKNLSAYQDKYIFGGRLGDYKYYDMDDTIEAALQCAKYELEDNLKN